MQQLLFLTKLTFSRLNGVIFSQKLGRDTDLTSLFHFELVRTYQLIAYLWEPMLDFKKYEFQYYHQYLVPLKLEQGFQCECRIFLQRNSQVH